MIARRRPGRSALAATLLASGLLVVAPATAASASWLQQSTANIGGSAVWQFTAVSCTSPNICMAVGTLSSTTRQLLSETRSPTGWTAWPVPEPQPGSILLGVWCVKAADCTAVGDSPSGAGTVPLIEHWSGSTSGWSIMTAPTPAGATFSELNAVSCTSPVRCLAVGDTQSGGKQSGGKQVPLTELWNGSSWKIKPTPKPPGQVQSQLGSISCPAQNKCFAVGSSVKNDIFKTLAEVWNGSKWQLQKTPSPAKNDSLNGVSCRSPSSCMAVGSGLAEQWNGKSWSVVKIAKPKGSAADLLGVSCARAGPCYAVGGNSRQNAESSVAELWNGSKWSVQPVAFTASSNSSLLRGVSCTTATNCTAAGFYHDPALGDRALAEDFSIRWQDVSPMPFNGVSPTNLNGVSCASPSACVAVGTFQTSSGFESFSESWNGTSWTSPRLLAKPKITSTAAVTCSAASDCMAVGSIAMGASTRRPMAEHWNGARWTLQKPPAPKGAARSFLFSISCPAKTSCFAVGLRTNASGQQRTLAEHWNGKTWKISATPNPAGEQEIELNSVSCPSVNSCVAVGTVVEGTFAQVWNGKSWQATSAVPNPKNAVHSQLDAVSCPSADNCIAVGRTFRNSKFVSLAEHWNGKKWSPQKAATPGGVLGSQLTGVSCSSGNACAAVGIESGASGPSAIAENWTGKRWVLHSVDIPAGAKSTVLTRVSCNSAVACMATGQYIDANSTGQMLAEHYA